MTKTQLELPFMMNVLLYIGDLQNLNTFLQVSKKCQECSLALKVNPLIKYKVNKYDYYFHSSDERKNQVEQFIDKIYVYFPKIQTLQLHQQQLKFLTENQFNKIERIRVNINDCYYTNEMLDKWGSKLTFITVTTNYYNPLKSEPNYISYEKAEVLRVDADQINEKILKMPSLRHVLIFVETPNHWTMVEQKLKIFNNVSFKVSVVLANRNQWGYGDTSEQQKKVIVKQIMKEHPNFGYSIKNDNIGPIEKYPVLPIDGWEGFCNSGELLTTQQDSFQKNYFPTDLALSYGCYGYGDFRNLVIDLSQFDSLTKLSFLARCKSMKLPKSLQQLHFMDYNKMKIDIENIAELNITSLKMSHDNEIISQMTNLKELDLRQASVKFKAPSTLTKLEIQYKITGRIQLNEGLKELEIVNLPGGLKLPKSLTYLSVPFVYKEGFECCNLKELTFGNLDFVIDSMIPPSVVTLNCGEVKKCSLSKSTQIKELMITPFVKKGRFDLKSIEIPTSIDKLVIWIDKNQKVDIEKMKDDMNKYFGNLKELILDGNFVDDLLSFDL